MTYVRVAAQLMDLLILLAECVSGITAAAKEPTVRLLLPHGDEGRCRWADRQVGGKPTCGAMQCHHAMPSLVQSSANALAHPHVHVLS
jgi:hypothetical protein